MKIALIDHHAMMLVLIGGGGETRARLRVLIGEGGGRHAQDCLRQRGSLDQPALTGLGSVSGNAMPQAVCCLCLATAHEANLRVLNLVGSG